MSTARYFEFADGTSNKFWEISLVGTEVRTRYGKLGTAGQTTVKEEGSAEKAQKLFDKLVREKTGKGYVEKGEGAVAAASKPQGYRARFVAMVDALKADSRISVTKFSIGDPASEALIATAKAAAGGVLPAGVAELYSEFNGFELEWELVEDVDGLEGDGELNRGLISILPIYESRVAGGVFSDWKDSMYFSEDDPLRPIKPFDFFVPEACAVFYPVLSDWGGKTPKEATIHYHYCGEELHPTGYTLNEYLDRLLLSRGYWYWMQSLCVDTRDSSESENFLNDAAILFKDFKASFFKPKTKSGEISL